MISKIILNGTATFGPEVEIPGLDKVNFFFGSNGSGKTTISRVIDDHVSYRQQHGFRCGLVWENDEHLESFVYNTDFIERNFDLPNEIQGIFMLGEEAINTRERIGRAKQHLDIVKQELTGIKNQIEANKNNETKHNDDFTEICWKKKKQLDKDFHDMFKGFHNNIAKFIEEVLEEHKKHEKNKSPVASIDDLKKNYDELFVTGLKKEKPLQEPEYNEIIKHERNPILKKIVVGKTDLDFAKLINQLNNSDWVWEGYQKHYRPSDNISCPFCQQDTPASLTKDLEQYFDKTFEEDKKAVSNLKTKYNEDYQRFLRLIQEIGESEFVEKEQFNDACESLKKVFDNNMEKINDKKEKPSNMVELEPLENKLDKIIGVVKHANNKIRQNNDRLLHIETQKNKLKQDFWCYFISLIPQIADFISEKKKLAEEKSELAVKKREKQGEEERKENEIKQLEQKAASIIPPVDEINEMLKRIGFSGFRIEIFNGSEPNCYKIVRTGSDEDARKTLSEGERNFITLLYFICLLRGSKQESGIESPRVAVFDDPVSSLDVDNLYFACRLIRNIIKEVKQGNSNIKQVFVMTHNVYFHKEITLAFRKKTHKNEKYWIVKKINNVSEVVQHDKNPIRSIFELLWAEYRQYVENPSEHHQLSIQNTMRRILEYYFTVLNGIELNEICECFEEQSDKSVCKALISWINAGSHVPPEDLAVNHDELRDKYCDIFEKIFKKSVFRVHYEKMMRYSD